MNEKELSKLRVICVDDSPFFIEIMRAMLRAFGIRHLVYAKSSKAALEVLSQHEFDILLADCLMPDMDGVEFIRRVRSEMSLPSLGLPIICVTAHAVRAMVTAAIYNGADGFLVKPVSANDLFACLIQHIENPLPRVSLPDYYGPDRRRNPDPNYLGIERRLAEIER